MAIKYDIYPTPSDNTEEETTYHARIIYNDTVTTKTLAEEIEFGTSLTEGDAANVLSSLQHLLAKHLLEGSRVNIDGIGTFQLIAQAPTVKDPKKMRADHLSVKSIRFIPDNTFKTKMGKAHFERAQYNIRSLPITMEEIKALLTDYFKEHTFITRMEFQQLCHLTRSTAQDRINKLIKEGFLEMNDNVSLTFYVLAEPLLKE